MGSYSPENSEYTKVSLSNVSISKQVAFYHLANIIPQDISKNPRRRHSEGGSHSGGRTRIVSRTYSLPLPTASAITKSITKLVRPSINEQLENDPCFIPDQPRRLSFKMPSVSSTGSPMPHYIKCDLKSCLKTHDKAADDNHVHRNSFSTYSNSQEVCPIVHTKRRHSVSTPSPLLLSEFTDPPRNESCNSQAISPAYTSAIIEEEEEDEEDNTTAATDDELTEVEEIKTCCLTCTKAYSLGLLPDASYTEKWSASAKRKRKRDMEELGIIEDEARRRGSGNFNPEQNSLISYIVGVDEVDKIPIHQRNSISDDQQLNEDSSTPSETTSESDQDAVSGNVDRPQDQALNNSSKPVNGIEPTPDKGHELPRVTRMKSDSHVPESTSKGDDDILPSLEKVKYATRSQPDASSVYIQSGSTPKKGSSSSYWKRIGNYKKPTFQQQKQEQPAGTTSSKITLQGIVNAMNATSMSSPGYTGRF